MKNAKTYWGVVQPDFLKIGKFDVKKVEFAIKWCEQNCRDKFISSDIRPWAFLNEQDAVDFQKRFGGEVKMKLKDD